MNHSDSDMETESIMHGCMMQAPIEHGCELAPFSFVAYTLPESASDSDAGTLNSVSIFYRTKNKRLRKI